MLTNNKKIKLLIFTILVALTGFGYEQVCRFNAIAQY